MRNSIRIIIFGIAFLSFLTILFTWPLVSHIGIPYDKTRSDAFFVIFVLNHYVRTLLSGFWENLATLPMYYGYQHSLFYSDHYALAGVGVFPMYLLLGNIVGATQVLSFFAILLSGLAMYFVLYIRSHSIHAAILGVVIFVFNPYVMSQFPDHLLLYTLLWIPLIFYVSEQIIIHPTRWLCFALFGLLTLQLLSSLYYAAYISVFLPLYMLVRVWKNTTVKWASFINPGTIVGMVIFILTIIISVRMYGQVFLKGTALAPKNTIIEVYSPYIADYVFPSTRSAFFGWVKPFVSSILPAYVRPLLFEEHNLFPGIVPVALMIYGFVFLRRKIAYYWLTILFLFISILLSLGPFIHLSDTVMLAGPYDILMVIHPLFGILRVPSRVAVFVFFFLALLCENVWKQLLVGRSNRFASIATGVLIFYLIIEYMPAPLLFSKIDRDTKEVLVELGSMTEIHTVVDLPIGNNLTGNIPGARFIDDDAWYLLLATYHNKPTLNGISGYTPADFDIRRRRLSVGFPAPDRLALLRTWGIDAILIHRDEYRDAKEYQQIENGLIGLGVPRIVDSETLSVFDLTKWAEKRER